MTERFATGEESSLGLLRPVEETPRPVLTPEEMWARDVRTAMGFRDLGMMPQDFGKLPEGLERAFYLAVLVNNLAIVRDSRAQSEA